MRLIVGLGNPGREYAQTRHNVGFMVLDQLVRELGGAFCEASKWEALTAEATVAGEKIIFMQPTTYVNLSGNAVVKFAGYYKLEPKDIWVVSDDLDLPLGRIRIRQGGGSGGHNGLKSIIEKLGSEDFYRIRLGIQQFTGDPKSTDAIRTEPEASVFVLQPFEKREEVLVQHAIEEATNLILAGLKSGQLTSHTLEIDPGPTVI